MQSLHPPRAGAFYTSTQQAFASPVSDLCYKCMFGPFRSPHWNSGDIKLTLLQKTKQVNGNKTFQQLADLAMKLPHLLFLESTKKTPRRLLPQRDAFIWSPVKRAFFL